MPFHKTAHVFAICFLYVGTTYVTTASPVIMRQEASSSRGSKSRLQSAIEHELHEVPSSRLFEVEQSVRPTFEAFPKNSMAQIPPRDIFPSIVRSYFLKEYGWLIKGLEPPNLKGFVTEVHDVQILQQHAPHFVSALQEAHESDRGISLSDVVGTIACIEKLILAESQHLLAGAYALNKIPLDESVTEKDLHEVLRSYILLYRQGTPHNLTDIAGHHEMKARAQEGEDWRQLVDFETQAVRAHGVQHNRYAAATVAKLTEDLTLKFGKWQNSECDDMKTTLMGIASRKGSGSVRFSAFHSEPAHANFQFTEDEEYLRKTGTLDESDNEGANVLIANYLRGPSNCIASSEYYSVCCLSECDSVMSELEQKIQAPVWPADRILEIVRETPSSSMTTVPRELSRTLVADLREISQHHDGAVPLHSADFRRWLHKAYPNECPRQTTPEDIAEDSEWKQAAEWLKAQSKCTRIPEWHPIFHEDSIEV